MFHEKQDNYIDSTSFISSSIDASVKAMEVNVWGLDERKDKRDGSQTKTLRKPAEQLKLFKGTAKTKYQKAFADINAVEIKLNGRLNDTTIILKAF